MEIAAVLSKPNAGKQAENRQALQNTADQSFLGSVSEAVRAGKIVMPGSVEMGKLDLLRTKFGMDGQLGFEECEEELVQRFLTRIRRVLEKRKESK